METKAFNFPTQAKELTLGARKDIIKNIGGVPGGSVS